MPFRPTTLILNAADSFGIAAARTYAARQHHLVMVADNHIELLKAWRQVLADYPRARIEMIVTDLSHPDASEIICETLQGLGMTIDHVVDETGIYGDFDSLMAYVASENSYAGREA